jgi:hypothetical protein
VSVACPSRHESGRACADVIEPKSMMAIIRIRTFGPAERNRNTASRTLGFARDANVPCGAAASLKYACWGADGATGTLTSS